MLSTIPATASLGSHSRRQDEIARSRAAQQNTDTIPKTVVRHRNCNLLSGQAGHHLHGVKATYRTDVLGEDRSGRASLAGINLRVCSCRVVLSRPARRPAAGGEVTARAQGAGVPSSAPVWW
jgi:hypothetical protein